MVPKSKLGLVLSTLYILLVIYLIYLDGVFGEGFFMLFVGMPWILITSAIIDWLPVSLSHSAPILYLMIFLPVIINTVLIYWIGAGVQKLFSGTKLSRSQIILFITAILILGAFWFYIAIGRLFWSSPDNIQVIKSGPEGEIETIHLDFEPFEPDLLIQ